MSGIYLSNQQHITFSDRALQYGEGLFETFRLNTKGHIPLWELHQQRLAQGLERLGFSNHTLNQAEDFLFSHIKKHPNFNAGKLLVSRTALERGYAGKTATNANLLLHLFTLPAINPQITTLTLELSPVRLAQQPLLAGIKHSSRLQQILALSKLSQQADDVLLMDTQGLPIESGTSNLLLHFNQQWLTPKLDKAGVKGTTRQWLMQKIPIQEKELQMDTIYKAQHLYLSNALYGIRAVTGLLKTDIKYQTDCAKMQQLQNEFGRLFT